MSRWNEPADTESGWRCLGLIRLLLLLDIAMLALVVYDAPYFKVARVLIGGTDTADVRELVPVADLRGKNVFAIDLDRVAKQIEAGPYIRRAIVERRFPNEIVIAVQERTPVAIWVTRAGAYLVDDEGRAIRPASGEQLPRVEADSGAELKLGRTVDNRTVALVKRLNTVLDQAFEWQPVRYEFAAPRGLTVTTNKGWRVTFGEAENLDYEFEVLKGVLETAKQRNQSIELVDLRSKVRPYYRPVQPVVAQPAATPAGRQ